MNVQALQRGHMFAALRRVAPLSRAEPMGMKAAM